jgi:hypothetical protein
MCRVRCYRAGAGLLNRRRTPAAMMHASMEQKPDRIVLTEQQRRARRARSIAIALALGVLVALFYVVTLVKGPAILNRPL